MSTRDQAFILFENGKSNTRMSLVSQLLLNSIQRSVARLKNGTRLTKVLLAVKFALRRLILRFCDPVVSHRIGQHQLLFPLSHNFPIDDVANPKELRNIARIAKMANDKFRSFRFIDIGANVGDTPAILRNMSYFPIFCLEGDETYYSFLVKNVAAFPEVHTLRSLVGEADQEVEGMLVHNYGGSKQVKLGSGPHGNLHIRNLQGILRDFPDFMTSKMLKIDTDGYDCKIIRGALKWLGDFKPIIFFEYDPNHLEEQMDDGISVFQTLREIGYENMLLYEGNGDFMFSSKLTDQRFIEELHCYFSGRSSTKYADVCVFHRLDSEFFEICRRSELVYYQRLSQSKVRA